MRAALGSICFARHAKEWDKGSSTGEIKKMDRKETEQIIEWKEYMIDFSGLRMEIPEQRNFYTEYIING